jgi:hypothetical protein
MITFDNYYEICDLTICWGANVEKYNAGATSQCLTKTLSLTSKDKSCKFQEKLIIGGHKQK